MDRKVLIGLALTLIIIAFIPLYWAAEPGRQGAAKARQTAEAAARGAALYTANCAVCHGAAGEGEIGPRLRDTRLEEDALNKVISRGRSGTVMPAWAEEDGGALKRHQIQDLVVFIRNWDQALLAGAKPASTLAPTPTAAPASTPPATLAPASEGRQLFISKGCVACHGSDAQGTTIAPALPGRSNKQVTNQVRNPGGLMPRFGPELISDAELEKIADYIESLAPAGGTR